MCNQNSKQPGEQPTTAPASTSTSRRVTVAGENLSSITEAAAAFVDEMRRIQGRASAGRASVAMHIMSSAPEGSRESSFVLPATKLSVFLAATAHELTRMKRLGINWSNSSDNDETEDLRRQFFNDNLGQFPGHV